MLQASWGRAERINELCIQKAVQFVLRLVWKAGDNDLHVIPAAIMII